MTTIESHDSNILDAETVNWRLIVYPLVAAIILVLGGFGYYYYQQNQRYEVEAQAREAFLQAKTPEQFAKVADQFPHTDNGTIALMSAADGFFSLKDYESATKYYQRVLATVDADAQLRDSAQLGLASVLEATGKVQDAINAYLVVGQRGKDSPFAPFALYSASVLCDKAGDKDKERNSLLQAASLDPDSPFVKQAQAKLKTLSDPVTATPATPPQAPIIQK